MTTAKKTFGAILCVLSCGLWSSFAQAEESNPLDAKFVLDIGWFFMSTDTRVRVDGNDSSQIGSDVDFDDTFGLGDFDRFRFDGQWRISGRHSIRATYFENNRSGSRSLTRNINFGDETYTVGTTVAAESNLTVVQVSYDYAFVRKETYEIAGAVGLHTLDMSLGLDATLSSGGGSISRRASESASTAAPLPVLGIRGLWKLPHDFSISAALNYFYLDFDRYTGSLTDLKASVVWQPLPHLGFGVGYNDFKFRFDIDDKGKFSGLLRWNYGGAIAFATLVF